jgi:hypothetical protein
MLHARQDYQNRIVDLDQKIGADEPVMLFRAQDKHFVEVLCFYYLKLVTDPNAKADIANAVRDHIQTALEWQQDNPTKTPDL